MNPGDLNPEDLLRLDYRRFQRFALDLVSVDLPADTRVEGFDRRGKDGGWDGALIGRYRSLSGTIRVEAKSTGDLKTVTRELKEYIAQYPEGPLLFVVAVALTKPQRDKLTKLVGSRSFEVLDGAGLLAIARRHVYILRAYGLLPSLSAKLLPLWLWRDRTPDHALARLPSEVEAARAAEAQLRAGDLILVPSPSADGDRVLRTLAATWMRATVGAAVWLDPEGDPQVQRTMLEEQLEGSGSLTLFVPEAVDEGLLGWLLRAPGVRLAMVRREPGSVVAAMTSQRRSFGRVPLAAPTPQELMAWSRSLAPHLLATAQENLIFELRSPELIERMARDGLDLTIAWLRACFDAPALTLVGWIAALGQATLEELRAGTKALGWPPQRMEAILDRALVDPPVLQREDERVWPLSETLATLLLYATTGWSEREDEARRRLLTLASPERRNPAIARMARLGHSPLGARAPARLAAWMMENLSAAEVDALLLANPVAFVASEEWFRSALSMLSQPQRDAHRRAAMVLADWGPAFPRLLPELWRVLRASIGSRPDARLQDQESRRLEASVDPRHLAPIDATRLLRSLTDELEEHPEPTLAAMLSVAIHLWTAANIRYEMASVASFTTGHIDWDAESADLAETFDAACAAIDALLRSPLPQLRDLGWMALRRFGHPRGLGWPEMPESPGRANQTIILRAADRLSQTEDWSERSIAESRLVWFALNERYASSLPDLLERLSQEPLYLLFRATWSREMLLLDTQGAIRIRDAEGIDALRRWCFEHEFPRDAAGLTRLIEQLVEGHHSTNDILRVLAAGDALGGRPGAGPIVGHEAALEAWAAREPALFWPLLRPETWRDLSPDSQSVVLRAVLAQLGPETELPEWRESGLRTELLRFLRAPARTKTNDALRLLPVVKQITLRRNIPATIVQLATHPAFALQEQLWYWLLSQHHIVAFDAEDLQAVTRALLQGDERLEMLGRISSSIRYELSPFVLEDGGAAEALLLDALERQLGALAKKESERWLAGNLAYELRPLLSQLLRRRPAAWWRCVPTFVGAGLEGDRDTFLSEVSESDCVALLRAGPLVTELRTESDYSCANATDFLVRQIPPERLAGELQSLLEEEMDRASSWLTAAELHPALIPATTRLLQRLPQDRADRFVELAGRGHGNSLGRVKVMSFSLLDNPSPAPTGDPIGDAYEAAAAEVGGLVGAQLRQLAAHHRGT